MKMIVRPPTPVTDVRFDGKFTVTYRFGDDESAFRVVPELGRLIAAAPEMLAFIQSLIDVADKAIAGGEWHETVSWLDDARTLVTKVAGV